MIIKVKRIFLRRTMAAQRLSRRIPYVSAEPRRKRKPGLQKVLEYFCRAFCRTEIIREANQVNHSKTTTAACVA